MKTDCVFLITLQYHCIHSLHTYAGSVEGSCYFEDPVFSRSCRAVSGRAHAPWLTLYPSKAFE